MRRSHSIFVGLILVALVATACGSDKKTTSAATTQAPAVSTTLAAPVGPDVTVSAKEYSFTTPAQIKGGVVNLKLENAGTQPHEAAAFKITGSASVDDVRKFFASPPGAAPPGPPPAELVGGPVVIVPGSSTTSSFTAPPGDYAFVCFFAGSDGVPHVGKGMIQGFTVVGDSGATLTPAAATITAADFKYPNLPSLKAGATSFTFKNGGTQDHEAQLAELVPGKTVADVKAFFAAATPSGPPPLVPAGGVAGPKGSTSVASVDLKAGTKYIVFCLIPDPADDTPHLKKGMISELTVA